MVLSNAYRFVVFRFSFTTNIYIYMASISVGYIYQTYIYIYKCVCIYIYIRIIKIHIYINIYLYSPIYSSLDSIQPKLWDKQTCLSLGQRWNLLKANGRAAMRIGPTAEGESKKIGGERKAQNNGPGIPETILPKEMITFHASLQGCKGIVWCHFFIFWVFIGILNKGDILKKSLHIG